MINFNSTTVKEAVLSRVPLIDIKAKIGDSQASRLDFLYHYDYCINLEIDEITNDTILSGIDSLSKIRNKDFDESIQENLFDVEGTSAKILDYFL